ncbi:antibiotic biosynthesis monooxygenase [Seongchinamella unica]|uniref:Antibiotic biosynthesis monooxygenase n=1 Tax=Seongchinamella unica TaxID=2547392 RepID=A0A4R5LNM9_9GAMM|nr:antibiotic biosynthesis monooxygenase [Seongchinamella unica]
MIQVITTVDLRPECVDEFLVLLGENIPKVKAESGCLAYDAMVDVSSGLPTQGDLRPNTVTVVEAWSDMEALQKHLGVPHMTTFREAAKPCVEHIRHQVLRPV